MKKRRGFLGNFDTSAAAIPEYQDGGVRLQIKRARNSFLAALVGTALLRTALYLQIDPNL